MKKLLTTLVLTTFVFSFSQDKDEREISIDVSQFPEDAQQTIANLPKVKRIRFYRETDGEKRSYEAKFKYKKHWYSLEFSEAGQVEDVEVKIKAKAIPEATLRRIESYLDANFDRFKFRRIQWQYVHRADFDALHLALKQIEDPSNNFEIVTEVSKDKTLELIEFTFDFKGQLKKQRTIKPTSYEHILY